MSRRHKRYQGAWLRSLTAVGGVFISGHIVACAHQSVTESLKRVTEVSILAQSAKLRPVRSGMIERLLPPGSNIRYTSSHWFISSDHDKMSWAQRNNALLGQTT